MKVALLDCDGVLGDFVTGCLDLLRAAGFEPPARRLFDGNVWLSDYLSEEQAARLPALVHHFRLAKNLSVVPGAQEAVRLLRENDFRVVVCTTPWASSHWVEDRYEWLWQNFEVRREDVVFAKDKSLVYGDLLVEDHLDNLRSWEKAWSQTGYYHCQQKVPWVNVLAALYEEGKLTRG